MSFDRHDKVPITPPSPRRSLWMPGFYVTTLGLTVILWLWRLWLLRVRVLGYDETQHLHTGWCFSRGLIPYRDFFEHHTPGLAFLLRFFLHGFDVTHNLQDAVNFIFFARGIMWILTGFTLLMVFLTAQRVRNGRVAAVSVLLLSLTMIFQDKTLEIRPDVPALLGWVVGLYCLIRAIQTPRSQTKQTRRWFAMAGVAIGVALMFTQKLLFAGPGIVALMLWYLQARRVPDRTGKRWVMNMMALGLGVLLPVLGVLAYFGIHHALGAFYEDNLALNAKWAVRFSPMRYLRLMFTQNPVIVLLGIAGSWTLGRPWRWQRPARRADAVLMWTGLSLLWGLWVIPVPYRQYFLFFLPHMAIGAAIVLVRTLDKLQAGVWPQRWHVLGVLISVVLLGITLWLKPSLNAKLLLKIQTHWPWQAILVWSAAGMMAVVFGKLKLPANVTLAGVLILLSLFPMYQIRQSFLHTNEQQLEQIRYVHAAVAPTQTVLDGWPGVAMFRPHAWRYFFLHREMRQMLSEQDRQNLLNGLKNLTINPKIVILDQNVKAFSPAITRYLTAHYESVGLGSICRRKDRSP